MIINLGTASFLFLQLELNFTPLYLFVFLYVSDCSLACKLLRIETRNYFAYFTTNQNVLYIAGDG